MMTCCKRKIDIRPPALAAVGGRQRAQRRSRWRPIFRHVPRGGCRVLLLQSYCVVLGVLHLSMYCWCDYGNPF